MVKPNGGARFSIPIERFRNVPFDILREIKRKTRTFFFEDPRKDTNYSMLWVTTTMVRVANRFAQLNLKELEGTHEAAELFPSF